MTNEINEGSAASAQPRRKWSWWHIALAVVGVVILLSLIGGGQPDLRVRVIRQGAGGFQQIEITNIGKKPVMIDGIVLNDRSDCRVAAIDQITNPDAPFAKLKLEVGEGNTWFTNCRVVRAAVSTSQGTATYQFQ